jgi:hypothetical protein
MASFPCILFLFSAVAANAEATVSLQSRDGAGSPARSKGAIENILKFLADFHEDLDQRPRIRNLLLRLQETDGLRQRSSRLH